MSFSRSLPSFSSRTLQDLLPVDCSQANTSDGDATLPVAADRPPESMRVAVEKPTATCSVARMPAPNHGRNHQRHAVEMLLGNRRRENQEHVGLCRLEPVVGDDKLDVVNPAQQHELS